MNRKPIGNDQVQEGKYKYFPSYIFFATKNK
ncbi:hypothetical protein OPIT5_27425 [Opitutaceae bacterium TAV5]|nr:hypothetical protein OPIT5_27425 [Opitutaceae bacterium TAV5]